MLLVFVSPIVSLTQAKTFSGSESLDFLEYLYVWDESKKDETITWSFQGSNNYVGIYVMAMDSDDFDYFDYGFSLFYYELSDGGYYIHSGTFNVPYDETWYIVFLNDDLDIESTYLDYEVSFNHSSSIGLIVGIVVGAIVGLAIVAGIIISINRKKSKGEPIQQPIQQPTQETQDVEQTSTVDSNVKFCVSCGSKSNVSVAFCENCGAEFK